MAQYIDKDALIAEIEKRIAALKVECDRSKKPQFTLFGKVGGLELCLSIINSLEVKEVDLDKEIDENYQKDTSTLKTKKQYAEIAKQFFELGKCCKNIVTKETL